MKTLKTNYFSSKDMPAIGSTFEKDGKTWKVTNNSILNQSTAKRISKDKDIDFAIELEFCHGLNYINIFTSSDRDGYIYDIYESKEDFKEGKDSLDGGICTGTISNAIEMAINQ